MLVLKKGAISTFLVMLLVMLPVVQAYCILPVNVQQTFIKNFNQQEHRQPTDEEIDQGMQATYQLLTQDMISQEVYTATIHAINAIPNIDFSERTKMLHNTVQTLLTLTQDNQEELNPDIITRLFTNVHNNNELQNNIELELSVYSETKVSLVKPETPPQEPSAKLSSGLADTNTLFVTAATIIGAFLFGPLGVTAGIIGRLIGIVSYGIVDSSLGKLKQAADEAAELIDPQGCSDCSIFRKILGSLLEEVDAAISLLNQSRNPEDIKTASELLTAAVEKTQKYISSVEHTWTNIVQQRVASVEMSMRTSLHADTLIKINEAKNDVTKATSAIPLFQEAQRNSLRKLSDAIETLEATVKLDQASVKVKDSKVRRTEASRIRESNEPLFAIISDISKKYDFDMAYAKNLVLDVFLKKYKTDLITKPENAFDNLYPALLARSISPAHAEDLVRSMLRETLSTPSSQKQLADAIEMFDKDIEAYTLVRAGSAIQFTLQKGTYSLDEATLNHIIRRHVFGVVLPEDTDKNPTVYSFAKQYENLIKKINIQSLSDYLKEIGKISPEELNQIRSDVLRSITRTIAKTKKPKKVNTDFGENAEEYRAKIGANEIRLLVSETGRVIQSHPIS